MGDYRSRSTTSRSYSYSDDRDTQHIDRYHGQKVSNFDNNYMTPYNFRSYSVSYGGPPPQTTTMDLVGNGGGRDQFNLKKVKSTVKSWSFNDPEFQRKKRVASYRAYSIEGQVKGSFRKSFRWLKDKYTRVVYGWW